MPLYQLFKFVRFLCMLYFVVVMHFEDFVNCKGTQLYEIWKDKHRCLDYSRLHSFSWSYLSLGLCSLWNLEIWQIKRNHVKSSEKTYHLWFLVYWSLTLGEGLGAGPGCFHLYNYCSLHFFFLDPEEKNQIWAATWYFQQCGILTLIDSNEPVQLPFKLRNSSWCSVSSLTLIEYSSD